MTAGSLGSTHLRDLVQGQALLALFTHHYATIKCAISFLLGEAYANKVLQSKIARLMDLLSQVSQHLTTWK